MQNLAQPQPPQRLPTEGYFDSIHDGHALGWAFDPAHPNTPVTVELITETGVVLSTTQTSVLREDLQAIGIGQGRVGFRLAIPDALQHINGSLPLQVRLRHNQHVLPGGPLTFPPARSSLSPQGLRGAINTVNTQGEILGWAWDSTHPQERVVVELLIGDEVVARGPADQWREDLVTHHIGDGHHAFALPISLEWQDGDTHALRMREYTTQTLLQDEPVVGMFPQRFLDFTPIPRAVCRKLLPPAQWNAFFEGFLRVMTRQTESARQHLQDLLQNGVHPALCHCKIAESWLLDGNPALALECYRDAAEHDPLFPWSQRGLGDAQRLLENFSEAEQFYATAWRLQSDDAELHQRWLTTRTQATVQRAQHLLDQGATDEAIRLLSRSYCSDPANPELRTTLEKALETRSPPATFDPSWPGLAGLAAFNRNLDVLEALLEHALPPSDTRTRP